VVRNGSARATSIPEILAELHRLTEEETLVTAEVIQLLEPLSRNDLQDERRGEEQKETDFGSIPQSWSLVPIAELTKQMQYGLSVRGGSTGRFPILRMNCQVDGKVVMRDLQFVDLSDELARDYKVNVGDILFNRTNSYELVGRTAIVEEETDAVFASYLVRVVADEGKADPRYLNYFLNWDVAQAVLKRLASRGVSQANISAGKLREFEIPAPPIKEQEAIAQVLAALDRKRNVARRKSVVLDRLNQALLHKLMTGEVRVRDLDLSAIPAQDALAKS
jgi:type I restriction enzyme S subunit